MGHIRGPNKQPVAQEMSQRAREGALRWRLMSNFCPYVSSFVKVTFVTYPKKTNVPHYSDGSCISCIFFGFDSCPLDFLSSSGFIYFVYVFPTFVGFFFFFFFFYQT